MEILIIISMLILAAAGLYTSSLIILHMLSRDNSLSARLCSTKGIFNCDAVLYSKLAILPKNVQIQDIALVYFIAQVLYFIGASINGLFAGCCSLLFFPSLIAFLITCALLYYQAFIVRSWCKLCLIITSVIWLQAIVMVFNYRFNPSDGSFFDISTFFKGGAVTSLLNLLFSLVIASAWFLLKPIVTNANETMVAKGKLLLLKSNINVFMTLLRKQPRITSEKWENDFFLGNSEATIQLLVAVNTYCTPCGIEYRDIFDILQKYPGMLGVTLRFLPVANKEHKTSKSILHLLSKYKETPVYLQKDILTDWYANPITNESIFQVSNRLDQDAVLMRYKIWFDKIKISHTPAVFINDYKLPPLYSVKDLKVLMSKLEKPLSRLVMAGH